MTVIKIDCDRIVVTQDSRETGGILEMDLFTHYDYMITTILIVSIHITDIIVLVIQRKYLSKIV